MIPLCVLEHGYLLFYRLITFYWITVREYAHLGGIARGEWGEKQVRDNTGKDVIPLGQHLVNAW